jgi:type I restriction enzyme M protein
MAKLGGVSPTVSGRIRELAERDAATVRELIDEVATRPARVDEQLKMMVAAWM